ncbi:ABC transporter ATP-binding protein [symbiont of Argiope bruennichi]|uniref:ABC transporter ATP-binding protein n=1 Tax=symbiont of Argiope bruennichi TaxID=2810479 RepID=UPI003DA3611B
MEKKLLISVENLSKIYKNKHALKNVNLEIFEDEKIAIIGKNGAGKTTLVEILSGIKQPTSGNINRTFGNTKVAIAKNIGIQFQGNDYPKQLKVSDIINFYRVIYKGNTFITENLNDLIKKFEIDEFFKQKIYKLSGGQRQRLNVLVALLHNPKCLILDELTTGLDIEASEKIKIFIKDLVKNNKWTLILISHNILELEDICERFIVVKDGEIFLDTTKDKLIEEYGSVKNYCDIYFNIDEIKKESNKLN